MLQEYSQKYGYKVEVFEKKKHEGREISSTYIKEELSKGNVELVNRLLGYNLVKQLLNSDKKYLTNHIVL